jgi:hypothetical protein
MVFSNGRGRRAARDEPNGRGVARTDRLRWPKTIGGEPVSQKRSDGLAKKYSVEACLLPSFGFDIAQLRIHREVFRHSLIRVKLNSL